MPSWVAMTIETEELVLNSQGGPKYTPQALATNRELVQLLDESIAEGRAALKSTTDDHLMKPWRLVVGVHFASEQPRHIVLSDAVFSHLVHHRG